MDKEKLSSLGLKELFVQRLQGMILSGELLVGSKLPPERTLAEQMQISRTVVNSGLAELAEQGFLEVRPRQGTYVADYRRQGNLFTFTAITRYKGGALDREDIRSVLEVRRSLEQLAADRAIRYASDETLELLRVPLTRIAAASNPDEAALAAFTFRHEMALAGGNTIAPLIFYSFKDPLIALWARYCGRYGNLALVRNAESLYSFLKKRDVDGAVCWINAYLERVISGSQQVYEP